MKVTATTEDSGFKPVKVEILLESQDEVELLKCICGYDISIPSMLESLSNTAGLKDFSQQFLTGVSCQLGSM